MLASFARVTNSRSAFVCGAAALVAVLATSSAVAARGNVVVRWAAKGETRFKAYGCTDAGCRERDVLTRIDCSTPVCDVTVDPGSHPYIRVASPAGWSAAMAVPR